MTTEPGSGGSLLAARWGWVAVVVAGLIAYHNSFSGVFVLDDYPGIVNATTLHSPDSLVPSVGTPRWLGVWTLAVNYHLGGLDTTGYHAVNLTVHLLAGVVLWSLVGRTFSAPRFDARYRDRAWGLATVVAVLWVVHPLTTGAVTYVIQRYESLMSLFALVGVWAAARSMTAADRRGRGLWAAASVVASLTALSTKEPAVALPFVVLAYDRLFAAGSWREAVRRRWPLYLALVLTWVMVLPTTRFAFSPPQPPAPPPLGEGQVMLDDQDTYLEAGFGARIGWWEYLRTQAGVILHYLRLAVAPRPLCLDYMWPVARHWWQIWPPGAVVVALLVLTGWGLVRGWAAAFAGVWFFGFLAVSSSIIPIIDLAFEHRTYLALAAVVAIAVVAGDRLIGLACGGDARRADRIGLAAAALTAAILAALTVSRNTDYHSAATMYAATLELSPWNGRARENLGTQLALQGRVDEAIETFRVALQNPGTQLARTKLCELLRLTGRWDELAGEVQEAVRRDPGNTARRQVLALALYNAGDPSAAVAEFRTAYDVPGGPRPDPDVYAVYGHALVTVGQTDDGLRVLGEAVRADPQSAPVRLSHGLALRSLGRYEEAHEELKRAAELAPADPSGPYQLGILEAYRNRPGEALGWFQEALRRNRGHLQAALGCGLALHDLGRAAEARTLFDAALRAAPRSLEAAADAAWRAATNPDPVSRNAPEALRLARVVVAGAGGEAGWALDVLAAAQAAGGDFAAAEATAARAVARLRAVGQTARAEQVEERRRVYAAGRPYHQPPSPAPRQVRPRGMRAANP